METASERTYFFIQQSALAGFRAGDSYLYPTY